MQDDNREALGSLLLWMGDDELILGHRDSEWCGHAPILEEDIAFANIALDEIGHAKIWYTLFAELVGESPDTYPDLLVFERSPQAFKNIQMVELPKGDWAFSILRQFLFDAYEIAHLEVLINSAYQPLAEAAMKIRKEEIYHYRHTRAWIQRLGQGTRESHHRMQNALTELWPYTRQLFALRQGTDSPVDEGYIPNPEQVRVSWQERVLPLIQSCELTIPGSPDAPTNRSQHTNHLKVLVNEMQSVARLDPQAEW